MTQRHGHSRPVRNTVRHARDGSVRGQLVLNDDVVRAPGVVLQSWRPPFENEAVSRGRPCRVERHRGTLRIEALKGTAIRQFGASKT